MTSVDSAVGRSVSTWCAVVVALGSLPFVYTANPYITDSALWWSGVEGWPVSPARLLLRIAATLAGALAIALGVLRSRSVASPSLAWACALIPAAIAGQALTHEWSAFRFVPVAVAMSLWGSAWVSFTSLFPRRIDPDELERPEPLVGLKDAYRRSRSVRTWRRINVLLVRRLLTPVPAWRNRLRRRVIKATRNARLGRTQPLSGHQSVMLHPWRFGAAAAGLSIGLGALPGLLSISTLVPATAFGAVCIVLSMFLLETGRRSLADVDDGRAVWISNGLGWLFLAPVFITLVFVPSSLLLIYLTGQDGGLQHFVVQHGPVMTGPVALAGFYLCLWVAVFWYGALDPHRAVSGAAAYSFSSAILLYVFEGAEEATVVTMSQFGMSDTAAPLVGIAVAAFAFSPIQSAVRNKIERLLDERMAGRSLAEVPRHTATVLFSDIVGYTALTSESEDDALTMMSVFHRVARKSAEQNKGRLVKTIGDEVLLEFKEPGQAVAAARQLTSSFADACEPLGLPPAQLRTGIHMGEVAKRRDGDLFGDAVNIASRLQGVAEPDQIIVSQAVAEQLDTDLEDLGEKALKNVPEPVRCYSVHG